MSTSNHEEQMAAVTWALDIDHFVIRFHGFVEMQLDEIRYEELVRMASNAELLEDYPDRSQGHSKLLLGFAEPDRPIHIVTNVGLRGRPN
jgi:hypothetical protein